ncbi:MAG: gliding motility-associated C-terminal domain-containing protein, partial [Bacteroidota bacterium]
TDFYFDYDPPPQCPTSTGTWIYTVTVSDGTWSADTQIVVNVYSPPVLSINYSNYICEDASPITLTGNPPGGTFSGPGVTGNTFNPVAAGGDGDYTITYSYAGVCPASQDSVIHVMPLPTAIFTAQSVCVNDPSTITYTGTTTPGSTFTWTFPSGTPGSYIGQFPPTVTWSLAGPYVCNLVVVDAYGCTASYDVTVTIMGAGTPNCCQMPEPEAGPPQTLCGLSAIMNATPSWGVGTWSTVSSPGGSLVSYQGGVNDPHTQINVSAYGTYTFAWTEDNGVQCDSSDNVTITFVEQPTANAGPEGEVCGMAFNLTGAFSTGSTGYWTGSAGVVFTPSTSPACNVTVPSYGVYNFTWTEENGPCTDNDQTTVVFMQPPAPDAGADDQTCGNNYTLDVTMSNPYNAGYWTSSPAGAIFIPNMYDPDAIVEVPLTGGSQPFTFTWYETNGICDGQDDVTITFVSLPNAEAGDNHDVCENTVTMNADTIGGYYSAATWSALTSGVTWENNDPTIPNAVADISGIVPAVYVDSLCQAKIYFVWHATSGVSGCEGTDTIYTIFYEPPVAFAGDDDSICGLTYDMSAVESINCSAGMWSVVTKPSGSTVNFGSSSNPTAHVTVSQFGLYEFQWQEANEHNTNCVSRDTVKIQFLSVPNIDAGVDQDVCGNWACLNANTDTMATGGTWLYAPVGWADCPDTSCLDNNQQLTVDPCVYSATLNTTILFVYQAWNNFCVSQDSLYVTFWKDIVATHLVGTQDSTQCGLTFEDLNAQTPQYGTGYWVDLIPSTQFWSGGVMNPGVISPDSAVAATYGMHQFVWVVVNGACRDTSDTVNIRFIEWPQADAGGAWDTACGYTYPLHANPSIGTGQWYVDVSDNTEFQSTNSTTSPLYNDTAVTQILSYNTTDQYIPFVWTEDNTNGCVDSDTIYVMFAIEPDGEFETTVPYCIGMWSEINAGVDLSINDTNYCVNQFQWTYPGGTLDTAMMSGMGYSYSPLGQDIIVGWPGTSSAQHSVTLKTRNCYGCWSPTRTYYVVEPVPLDPPYDVYKPAYCGNNDGSIVLDMGNSEFDYQWLLDTMWLDPVSHDSTITGGIYHSMNYVSGNDSLLIDHLYGAMHYYIVVMGESTSPEIGAQGYFCYDTLNIYMPDTGEIVALFDSIETSFDDYVVPESVSFLNETTNGIRYYWLYYTCDGEFVDEGGEDGLIDLDAGGCYQVYLIAESREGCRDTSEFLQFILDDGSLIEVPNVFSPNGDGKNDYFKVKYKTIGEFHCVIMDRWGKKIYEWDDVKEGWDGNIKGSSREASPGVYFYIITATGKDGVEYEFQGSFHLFSEK